MHFDTHKCNWNFYHHYVKNFNLKKNKEQLIKIKQEKSKKYQQIIKLLANNKIDSYFKFLESKNELFEACQKEDIKFVTILTGKEINHEIGLSFILNEDDKTAGILRNITATGDFFIPRSITYENQEYTITKIHQNASNYWICVWLYE